MSVGRFVALLRAVNVGGTGKLPMAELRAALTKAGHGDVQTLIASGNVVLDGAGTGGAIEKKIESVLKQGFGLETDVFVRSAEEWRALLRQNPFVAQAERDPARLVVVTLKAPPSAAAIAQTRSANKGNEQLEVVGRDVYVVYPDGIGVSKLGLKPLGPGTARNFNTVRKLGAML